MLGLCWATHGQNQPSIEAVCECLEHVSGTWKPLPLQADQGKVEGEDDWNFTVLTVWIFILIWFALYALENPC